MKVKRKVLSLVGIMMILTVSAASANGYPVFDVSNWLAAIDAAYTAYDQVEKTITQIENQYKTIQKAVEQAKSIDWDNVQFDGDFDIRDDIRNANRRVNRLLNQVRKIRDTIEKPSINMGNAQYSIADLCGAGDPDPKTGLRKNVLTALTDYSTYMADTIEDVVDKMSRELTEEEKTAIWQRYGISPKNYLMVRNSACYFEEKLQNAMANVNQTLADTEQMEREAEADQIIKAAMENTDSDGNVTAAGQREGIMRLIKILSLGLIETKRAIQQQNDLAAAKMCLDKEKEEAKLAEEHKAKKLALDKGKKFSSDMSVSDNKNSWLDLPVVAALEYFQGILATAMRWAIRYAKLFGIIGLAWSGFKVMMNRMKPGELFWDTTFKWAGFVLLLFLYVPLTNAIVAIGTEMGEKAGGGKEAISEGLIRLKTSLEEDIDNSMQYKIYNNMSELQVLEPLALGEMDFSINRNETVDSYTERIVGQINSGNNFRHKGDKEAILAEVEKIKKAAKEEEQHWLALKYKAIDDVIVTHTGGENDDPKSNLDSNIKLNIKIKYADKTDSPFISPTAMLKLTLLSARMMWANWKFQFNEISEDIKNDRDKKRTGITAPIERSMDSLSHTLSGIPEMIEVRLCGLILVVAICMALIQYIMTAIEYSIVTSIAAIFLPLMLFDGTKDIPKKFIPTFTSFLIKFVVMTICIYFVFYLMLENCINVITKDGGNVLVWLAETFFISALAYVLTSNSPKIAQTILTGQPQLSMGEALQGAVMAVGTFAAAKQLPGAVAKAGVKAGDKAISAYGNHMARKGASDAAKAEYDKKNPNGSKLGRTMAGAGAAAKVAGAQFVSKVKSGTENLRNKSGTGISILDKGLGMLGIGGNSSGAGGSGSGSAGKRNGQYGTSMQQNHTGESLSNTSNPDFKGASKYDENTRSNIHMTAKEFADEKYKQGQAIYNGSSNQNSTASSASESGTPAALPDNVTGENRGK